MNQRSQYFCYAKTALPSNFFSIHGEWFEKDITKVRAESLPDVDLWTGGFPCQDVSMAGERRGLYGERTGLFFEFIRLLREGGNHKPVSSTFATQKHPMDGGFLATASMAYPIQCRRYGTRSQNGFAKGKVLTKKMLRESFPLAEAGILPLFYVNWPHWATVWNTHLSIPKTMVFPKAESVCTLSEILQVVPQRYAVAESNFCEAKALNRSTGKIFPLRQSNKAALAQIVGGPQGSRIYNTRGVSPTISAGSGGLGAKTGLYFVARDNQKGLVTKPHCGIIDVSYHHGLGPNQHRTGILQSNLPRALLNPCREHTRQNGRRMKEEDEEMFTLTATDIHGILMNSRIRRLTPLETFRLQGVPDEYFYKVSEICSDTQLYKQIGNAVTVPVVRAVGEKIKSYMEEEKEQGID